MTNLNMRQTRTLDNDYLRRRVPAVFTETGHIQTSDRYTNVPTIQVIDALRKENFFPVWAKQANSRRENGELFAPHAIKFRHGDMLALAGDVPEISYLNSHDGKSALKIDLGYLRGVCANGLVVGSKFIEQLRVVHSGDILGDVVNGVYRAMEYLPKIHDQIDNLKSITLSNDQQLIFAQSAQELKWDRDDATGKMPFDAIKLLQTRRAADRDNTLWTMFNKVQENIIKGGVRHIKQNKNGRLGRATTRPVNSIKENNRLNKSLWSLTEKMAELV